MSLYISSALSSLYYKKEKKIKFRRIKEIRKEWETFGDGVLGQFAGEEETHRRLHFTSRQLNII